MTREAAYCFAADLGGTKLAAAIADARGRIVAELTEPTDPRGAAYVAEQISACAGKLAQSVGIEVTRTRHVMVGVPGAVDPHTGRVSVIPNIDGMQDFDLLGYLRSRFGPDVAIENDVNLDRYRRHGGTAAVTVRDIFKLLEEGDEVAASVLDTTARWVALAVVTLQSLLDLELSRPINIAPSQLGDRAGLIGAVCAATRALRQNPGPAQCELDSR